MWGKEAQKVGYCFQDACLVDFSRQHGEEDQSPQIQVAGFCQPLHNSLIPAAIDLNCSARDIAGDL